MYADLPPAQAHGHPGAHLGYGAQPDPSAYRSPVPPASQPYSTGRSGYLGVPPYQQPPAR